MTTQTLASEPTLMTVQNTFSKKRLWRGRILSGWGILFLLVDGVMKLFKPAPVLEATLQLGYPESTIVAIGSVILACTALYAIPRTSVLAAILWPGFLGGA